MRFPNKKYIEQLRKKYPVGTKIQLISMRDETYPVLPGTIGEVTYIDDIGSIHMKWENGSSPCIDSGSGFFQDSGGLLISEHLFHRTVSYHRKATLARVYLTQSSAQIQPDFSVDLTA